MKKGKDKNRVLYLESKEKFRLCELLFLRCSYFFTSITKLQHHKWGLLGAKEHSHWGLFCSTADWSTNSFLVSGNLKDPTSEASTVPPKTFFQKEGLTPRKENTSQQKAHSCVTLIITEAPLHSQSWCVENSLHAFICREEWWVRKKSRSCSKVSI